MELTVKQAKRYGYRITSRKYRLACRVDRPDWQDLTKDADLYRRCYSKDCIEVPASWLSKLPNSQHNPCGYREKP